MFNSIIIAALLRILPTILVGLGLIIVATVIGFYCYYKYAHWNDDYWLLRNVPLILRDEFISVWDQFTLKFRAYEIDLQIYQLMKKRNLKFVGLMEFRRPIIYIRDLDLIKAITIKDFDHFVNHRSSTFYIDIDKPRCRLIFHHIIFNRKEKPIPESNPSYCIQFGLLLMRNKAWKELRSVMTAAYSTLKIKRMFELFVESGDGLLDFISKDPNLGSPTGINVTDLFRRILINTTCSVAFGLDSKSFEPETSIYHKMSQTFEFQFHGIGFLKIYPILLIGKRIIQLEHMKENVITFFKKSIADTIEYRNKNNIVRNDFLNILLETRQEAQRENKQINLSDDVLFAQCIVFFLAGYINVAVALVYTIYELARNPTEQQKLREECLESLEKDGKLTYEAINGMKYLDCVFTGEASLERQ